MRLPTHPELLTEDAPAGVTEALAVVSGFDALLARGLARTDADGARALAELAGAVATTPLRDRVAEAAGKVAAGSVAAEYVVALAAARTAVLGAVHDALLARLDAALGRSRAPWEPAATPETTTQETAAAEATAAEATAAGAAPAPASEAAVAWLREVALAGWRAVDDDLVTGAGTVVRELLTDPAGRRLAVLLDGVTAELRAGTPVATLERLPLRRWGDLWSRAVLLAATAPDGPEQAGAERVSGRLLPLGVEVREHASAVQLRLHAVLEPAGGGAARLVRTSVTAAKVDTIVGPALWQLFGDYPVLLGALAHSRAVECTELALRPGGDLVWQEQRVTAGDAVEPFTTARLHGSDATAPPVPPLLRHPTAIAEPVLVEGECPAVALDRLPACAPLTPELVRRSTACVGLLRWDAGSWSLEPLAVQVPVKKKPATVHTGQWALGQPGAKGKSKSGDSVAVLRERAGRLLRR